MSAAVFSEPTDPHRRLSAPVTVPRDRLLGRMGLPPGAPLPVRLRVWGVTEADLQYAADRAQLGVGRAAWEFVETEPLRGAPCPLDMNDPKALATESGYDWAYAAYPAEKTTDG